ncbi:hypothetical protein RF55_12600, partial [Lasius niger]
MERQADNLIQDQRELHGRIARVVENMRKAGQGNITQGTVQSRLQKLETYWSKFELQHETLRHDYRELIKLHDYVKKDFYGIVEEAYLNQKATLLDYEAEFAREAAQANPPATLTTPRADPAASRSTLPRIQMPHFTGKYEDWPAFRDLFQSIIGRDGSLSEVEKLHYFKVSLKSDAEALIKNIPTTAENYQRAWTTLSEQFENKRLLVRSCLSKFTALTKMKAESANELRKILHSASSTVGTLESIGRPISSTDDLFVFLVVELLDARTRREWENSINDSQNPPTYSTLKRFLERRVQTLEAIQPSKSEIVANKSSDGSGRSARTHHLQKREGGSGRCSLCKRDHALMMCDEFRGKTATDRRHYVDSNHLCANCLGRHKMADCPSKRLCSVCSEKHHISLHDAFRKAQAEVDAVKTSHVAHGTARQHSTVLLATARIRVADRFGNLQEARAL